MKRRINAALAILLVAVLFTNTGCQLALEDAGEEKNPDRLIGVYVTREYLDLFDAEGYLSDHTPSLSGGEIRIDRSAGKYQGRIYATLAPHGEYVFDDMEGISFFAYRVVTEGEQYTKNAQSEEISNARININVGDNKEEHVLEGTVYVVAQGYQNFYMNPVYQSADGSVYLTAGTGMSGDLSGEGSFATTISETTTETADNITKTQSMTVKLELCGMVRPEKTVLMQMDQNGALLARDEYVPGTLPESITPLADAAWIIAETQKQDRVTREIYERGEESLETFYAREDGICIASATSILWENSIK